MSIAIHMMQRCRQALAAVRAVSTAEQLAATVAKTDVLPSHLWLNDDNVFVECILVQKQTPRTAKMLFEHTTAVVSCRRLWPWIPKLHLMSLPANTGHSEQATMTAAELLFADMCSPCGAGSLTPAVLSTVPTHMFLNADNAWTP